MREYNAESPKHDSKRFNSQAKTKYIADLGILFIYAFILQVEDSFSRIVPYLNKIFRVLDDFLKDKKIEKFDQNTLWVSVRLGFEKLCLFISH